MPWFCRPVPCLALWLALLLTLAGCASRPATAPLRTIAQPSPCEAQADTLLVLLPGTYSLPEDFVREGFVRAVREAGLAADVLLVDAHTGYYENRSIVDRLHADVVRPARARGYRQVWLAGILKRGSERGEFRLASSPAKTARLVLGALQGALLVKRTTGDASQQRDVVTVLKSQLASEADRRR